MATAASRNFKRLVVVSNRLPVALEKDSSGRWKAVPGKGGLVTALSPVLRDRGGKWVGWLGFSGSGPKKTDDLLLEGGKDTGYTLESVELTSEEMEGYYYGFSNEIVWPLFHDLLSHCNFNPGYWPVYREVNRKFADVIAQKTEKSDFIWVQDYHLMLVARELQEIGVQRRTGFFLHIPFPSMDLFRKLPWRREIIESLLQFELLGFQTMRDRRNFLQCAKALIPGIRFEGRGQVGLLRHPDREVRVGAFPISIDFHGLAQSAGTKEVADRAWLIHEDLPKRQLILGVDRLDYSKGIPQRILAIGNALDRYPEMRRKVTFVQVVVPSRVEVPEYQILKRDIERLVGEVNGNYTQSGWTPIHYIFRPLEKSELIAYYRTCEIALITPLKDGMNLVAKEYCACSLEENGVLILSEFAGAAAQLNHGALLVNPFDVEGTADAIYKAFSMDPHQRFERMSKLRRSIQNKDIFRWVDSFLQTAIAKNLQDFPQLFDFIPSL